MKDSRERSLEESTTVKDPTTNLPSEAPQLPFPNRLFLTWLTEWEEDAKRRDLKIKFSLRKAIGALKCHGGVLNEGHECRILDGIGEMTAKRLDDRYKKYKEEHGLKDLNHEQTTTTQVSETEHGESIPKTKNTTLRKGNMKEPRDEEKENEKTKQGKIYVPRYRSGPYAILLALLLNKHDSHFSGFMTKRELIKKAQSFCDSSMDTPEVGKFHTGWSSMAGLVEKGLVHREGGKVHAKFYLTEEGEKLAEKIRIVAKERGDLNDPSSSLTTFDSFQSSKFDIHPVFHEHKSQIIQQNMPRTLQRHDSISSVGENSNSTRLDQDEEFYYEYLDDHDKPTLRKECAAVLINDKILYKIRYPAWIQHSILNSHMIIPQIHVPEKEGCLVALIPDVHAADKAPGLVFRERSLLLSTQETMELESDHEQNDWLDLTDPLRQSSSITAHQSSFHSEVEFTLSNCILASNFNNLIDCHFQQWDPINEARSESFTYQKESLPLNFKSEKLSQSNRIDSMEDEQDIIRHTDRYLNTLPAGTFDIFLVLDNREVRQKSDRSYIQLKLFEHGVQCYSRSMELGDVVWIAKSRQPNNSEEDEVLLNFIIERKRMDDLVASIKDGRFSEQKFRLKQCGLHNVIYLIEGYGGMNDVGMDPTSLQTAITHTQVIDDFFVKRTESLDDTIAYLVMVTQFLRQEYLNKDLYVIRERAFLFYDNHIRTTLSRLQFLLSSSHILSLPTFLLIPYAVFQDLNTKSKSLTLHDLFIKQLLQIRGLSAVKVTALVQRYATLMSLLQAYDAEATEAAKEALLSQLPYGPHQRLLGPTMSKKLYHLFCVS